MDKLKGLENESQIVNSYENGRKTRDLEVTGNVALMASLGCFDSEFTFWGCTFKEDETIKYRISGKETEIIEFVEDCIPKDIYPSAIRKFMRRCPVPAGAKETISQLIKVELARDLYKAYPDRYYDILEKLSLYAPNDDAAKIFFQWQGCLEGRYLRDELVLFELTLNNAYGEKILKRETFDVLKKWLRNVYEQMEDDIVAKDLYHRTFYGIGFIERQTGSVGYDVDARKEAIYRKKEKLLKDGYLVTPIFEKEYWFKSLSEIRYWKEIFQMKLVEIFDSKYFELLQTFNKMKPHIPPAEFDDLLRQMQETGSEYGVEDLKMYGRRFKLY